MAETPFPLFAASQDHESDSISYFPTRRIQPYAAHFQPQRRNTRHTRSHKHNSRLLFPEHDTLLAKQAAFQRRRLLSIFGRMMARFYELHERRLSMGRWKCSFCGKQILAWCWVRAENELSEFRSMHEECVNRSTWEMVLRYDYLERSSPDAFSPLHIHHAFRAS